VHLDIIKVFYLPTDAQVNFLKNNIKIYIKTAPTCFGAVAPSSSFVLAKVTVVEGEAVPLQAWKSSECSRKSRFPDFMRTGQDGGKVVSLTHRPPLPPGNKPGTHFC
jgi:hypothetical protein